MRSALGAIFHFHVIIALIKIHSLITFYGAFYRDGAITIALEFMDGGSLANVLAQLGAIPERVLASMAYQVLTLHGYVCK